MYVMVNNKAQMKIQQTAFVLIAVTVFFVLVGMFVLIISYSNLQQSATNLNTENALITVSRIADSPEFSCGNVFPNSNINCIDEDKAMALSEESHVYSNFWGVSGIEIRTVSPANNIPCTQANYPNCGTITILKSNNGTGVSNFISLCRKDINQTGNYSYTYNRCTLARMIVTYKA